MCLPIVSPKPLQKKKSVYFQSVISQLSFQCLFNISTHFPSVSPWSSLNKPFHRQMRIAESLAIASESSTDNRWSKTQLLAQMNQEEGTDNRWFKTPLLAQMNQEEGADNRWFKTPFLAQMNQEEGADNCRSKTPLLAQMNQEEGADNCRSKTPLLAQMNQEEGPQRSWSCCKHPTLLSFQTALKAVTCPYHLQCISLQHRQLSGATGSLGSCVPTWPECPDEMAAGVWEVHGFTISLCSFVFTSPDDWPDGLQNMATVNVRWMHGKFMCSLSVSAP